MPPLVSRPVPPARVPEPEPELEPEVEEEAPPPPPPPPPPAPPAPEFLEEEEAPVRYHSERCSFMLIFLSAATTTTTTSSPTSAASRTTGSSEHTANARTRTRASSSCSCSWWQWHLCRRLIRLRSTYIFRRDCLPLVANTHFPSTGDGRQRNEPRRRRGDRTD